MADHIPKSPEDWADVPLGAGQEPTARKFQASDKDPRKVRHHPDTKRLVVVVKYPERPY